jgi:hypothetical protein
MTKLTATEPSIITDSLIDPRWDWSRPIASPGRMAVDFEERVDFRRLHNYRVGRTRKALAESDLGAILCFDNNNIRYLTSSAMP